VRNAGISRQFERGPIQYALETGWPVGAGNSNLCISESAFAKSFEIARNWAKILSL
jgi:hypothetical protein